MVVQVLCNFNRALTKSLIGYGKRNLFARDQIISRFATTTAINWTVFTTDHQQTEKKTNKMGKKKGDKKDAKKDAPKKDEKKEAPKKDAKKK